MGIIDVFLVQPYHFLPSRSPSFWSKIQQLCGCSTSIHGYILLLCHSKNQYQFVDRFIKPIMGIIDRFIIQLTIFYKADPHFGAKLSIFVAVLTKNTYVHSFRLLLHHSKVNISPLARSMKPGIGIIDGFLVQYCQKGGGQLMQPMCLIFKCTTRMFKHHTSSVNFHSPKP